MQPATPRIDPDLEPVLAPNPAARIRHAFEGGDIAPLIEAGLASLDDGMDPAVLMDLGVLYQLVAQPENAMTCQSAALSLQRLYRHPRIGRVGGPVDPGGPAPLRRLALVGPGDLMSNTPLDLMLEGCAVEVTKLYLPADLSAVPEHDVAIIAVSESDEKRDLLATLKGMRAAWPRPVINDPDRIIALARDSLYTVLEGAPGVVIPPTPRVTREELVAMMARGEGPQVLFEGGRWPIIIRPIGSHAGKGLEKIDGPGGLVDYLSRHPDPVFYVSLFVDYASPDGRFRKYRIAFFDGRPFLCHLAVGDRWMVHYLNADMAESPGKRAEEARAMAGFDAVAARHAEAFAALRQRLGLEYFGIDCAETPDGKLLVFEADVAMIVHDLDPVEVYPYKKPQMRKVFDGFEALLRAQAAKASPG